MKIRTSIHSPCDSHKPKPPTYRHNKRFNPIYVTSQTIAVEAVRAKIHSSRDHMIACEQQRIEDRPVCL